MQGWSPFGKQEQTEWVPVNPDPADAEYEEYRADRWARDASRRHPDPTDFPPGCRRACAHLLRLYRSHMASQPGFGDTDMLVVADTALPPPSSGALAALGGQVAILQVRRARDGNAVVTGADATLGLTATRRAVLARVLYEAAALYACERVAAGCVPPRWPSRVQVTAGGSAPFHGEVVPVGDGAERLEVLLGRALQVRVDARLQADVVLFLAHVATRVVLAPQARPMEWNLAALSDDDGVPREVLRAVSVRAGRVETTEAAHVPADYLHTRPGAILGLDHRSPDRATWDVRIDSRADGAATVVQLDPRAGDASQPALVDVLAVLDTCLSAVWYPGGNDSDFVVRRGPHRVHAQVRPGRAAAEARWARGGVCDSAVRVEAPTAAFRDACLRLLAGAAATPPRHRPAKRPVSDAHDAVTTVQPWKRPTAGAAASGHRRGDDDDDGDRVDRLADLLCGRAPVTRATEQPVLALMRARDVPPSVPRSTFTFPFVRLALPADGDVVGACLECLDQLVSQTAERAERGDGAAAPSAASMAMGAIADRMTALVAHWIETGQRAPPDASEPERDRHARELLDACAHELAEVAERVPRVRAMVANLPPPAGRRRPRRAARRGDDARPGVHEFMADDNVPRNQILYWLTLLIGAREDVAHAAVDEVCFNPGTTFLTGLCLERVLQLPRGVAPSDVSVFRGRRGWEVVPLLHMVAFHDAFAGARNVRDAVDYILDGDMYRSLAERDARAFVLLLADVLECVARMGRVYVLDRLAPDHSPVDVARFLLYLCRVPAGRRAVSVACLVDEVHIVNCIRKGRDPAPPATHGPRIPAEDWERIWRSSTASEQLHHLMSGTRMPADRVLGTLETIQSVLSDDAADPVQKMARAVLMCVLMALAHVHRPSETPGEALSRHNRAYITRWAERAKIESRREDALRIGHAHLQHEHYRGAIAVHMARAVPPHPSGRDTQRLASGGTRADLALLEVAHRPPARAVQQLAVLEGDGARGAQGEWIRLPEMRAMWEIAARLVHDGVGASALREARRVYVPCALADTLLGVVVSAALERGGRDAALCTAVCSLSSLRRGHPVLDAPAEPLERLCAEAVRVVQQGQTPVEGPGLFWSQMAAAYARVRAPADDAAALVESRCAVLDAIHDLAARYEQDPRRTDLLVKYVGLCLLADAWCGPQGAAWPGWAQIVGAPQVGEYVSTALYITGRWLSVGRVPDAADCVRVACERAAGDGLGRALSYAMPLLARCRGRAPASMQLPNRAYLLHADVLRWMGALPTEAKPVTSTEVISLK